MNGTRSTRRGVQPRLLCLIIGLVVGLTTCDFSREPAVAAPWSAQLAAAQRLAQQIDPDAVLEHVVAGPLTAYPEPRYESLDVAFYFIGPSREMITVVLEDTAVVSTIEVKDKEIHNHERPTAAERDQFTAEREQLTTALATVRLSAADALHRTIAEGQAFTDQHQAKLTAIISLHLHADYRDIQQDFGIPAAWSVLYLTSDEELRIWVNPQTGEIIARERRPIT